MLDPAAIQQALQPLLPAAPPADLAALAQLLADVANTRLDGAALEQRLATEPSCGLLIQQLLGQQIRVGDALLEIQRTSLTESPNSLAGVRIGVVGDPAGASPTSGAHQQGLFISGGTVSGLVVGINEGTINHTAITVNVNTGTLLDPAAQPNIVRCALPRPPLPVRNFYDRVSALNELQAELQPRHGAWLTGQLGCGITALLQQAANSPPIQSFADGVLYIDGTSTPSDADDLVQSLYNHFYKSASGAIIRLNPAAARSELSNLQALFLLDRPRLDGAALAALADTLAGRGALLVSAEGPAPATLLDLPLDSLPRADALKLCAAEARIDGTQPEVAALLDRLCAALGDLPLPLLLAARLLRTNAAPLAQLVDVAQELTNEREPLVRAAKLSLTALSDQERAALAALVRVGDSDAELAALSAASQLTPEIVEDAMARMLMLRLVSVGDERYSVATASLRRVLARLLPRGEERSRAAAFFAGAAALHVGDMAWLEHSWGNLVAAARASLLEGHAAQAGVLLRAVQPHMVLNGLWGGWGEVIELAEQAAQSSGDQALRAWSLHEHGTRAGLLGDLPAAATQLNEARRLRQELGDQAGADATLHNLRYLGLLPPPPPPPRRLPRALIWGVVLALLIGMGGIVGLANAGIIGWPGGGVGSLPTGTPTDTSTPTPAPISPTDTSTPQPPASATATSTPTPTDTSTPTPTDTSTPTPTRIPLVVVATNNLSTTLEQFSESYQRDTPEVDLRFTFYPIDELLKQLFPTLPADVLVGNSNVMLNAIDRGVINRADLQPLTCLAAPPNALAREFSFTYAAPLKGTAQRELALAYIAALLKQVQQRCPTPVPTSTPFPLLIPSIPK
jgi:hypothetical protein